MGWDGKDGMGCKGWDAVDGMEYNTRNDGMYGM